MKEQIEGHKYELESFEGKRPPQVIQFIQKTPGHVGADQLATVTDGTTNEEVLRMLICRMRFLQDKVPCRENAIVITNLEESLMWLEKRTAERKARGVEGTAAK